MKQELKLIYKRNKLERVELEGRRIEGLCELIKDTTCPTLDYLIENYEVKEEQVAVEDPTGFPY